MGIHGNWYEFKQTAAAILCEVQTFYSNFLSVHGGTFDPQETDLGLSTASRGCGYELFVPPC